MSRGRNRPLEKFGRFYALAFEMVIAVFVPVLIGRWLDSRTGKEPWFTIIGMLLGGAAALRSAHRALTESLKGREIDDGARCQSVCVEFP